MINNLNVIAHRGIHDKITPENSLSSFKRAIKKNIPIELDVHILKDNTVIVFHDDNLKRMTGVNKEVKNCTYEEIKDLFLKGTYDKIPKLSEVLELVSGKVKILIELKCDVKNHLLEDKVLEITKNYSGEILFKSFSLNAVKYMKKNTNRSVGLLIGNVDKKIKSKLIRFLIKRINYNIFLKPDFISCDYNIINQANIRWFKNKNKPIFVWTIKNIIDYNNLKNRCDYLIVEKII